MAKNVDFFFYGLWCREKINICVGDDYLKVGSDIFNCGGPEVKTVPTGLVNL